MCMYWVFSEKTCLLPFSLLIANGPFGRHGPCWRIADLSSLGHEHSWKRARSVGYNSWTTGSCAGSAAAVSAADSSSGAGNGVATSTASIGISLVALGRFVFARCGGCEKANWSLCVLSASLSNALKRLHHSASGYLAALEHFGIARVLDLSLQFFISCSTEWLCEFDVASLFTYGPMRVPGYVAYQISLSQCRKK